MNITLGLICGDSGVIKSLSKLALYSAFSHLEGGNGKNSDKFNVKRVLIIDQSKDKSLLRIATRLFGTSKVFEVTPSAWDVFKLPPMSNGSYATYFKFDIFKCAKENEIILYLDADTIINRQFNKTLIINLFRNTQTCLLMVPSLRPVYERIGYYKNSNPLIYYNAGVIFYKSKDKFNMGKFKLFIRDYLRSDLKIDFHDQDLINAYFNESIIALPPEYNLSTGYLKKEFNKESGINYLLRERFQDPYILHASGGVLFKQNHIYPFKSYFIKQLNSMIKDTSKLSSIEINEMVVLRNMIAYRGSWMRKLINKFRTLFRITPECHPGYYKESHYKYKVRKIMKSLLTIRE